MFTFTAPLLTLQDDCSLPDTVLLDLVGLMLRTDDKTNTSVKALSVKNSLICEEKKNKINDALTCKMPYV